MTWIIQDNLTGISIKEETKSRTRQDSLVCTINKHGYLKDKCNANARLIASAPELLMALECAVGWLGKAIESGALKDCVGIGALESTNYPNMLDLINKARG